MRVNDFGKIILIGIALACITVLMLFHDIEQSSAVSFYTLIVGYLIGNGKAAISGNAPSPVMVPSNDKAIEQLHKVADVAQEHLHNSGEVPVITEGTLPPP